jgi:plastocyanin
VTSDTGIFDSGSMSRGSNFSHTFSEAGTFGYYCIPHPYMTGTITVQ